MNIFLWHHDCCQEAAKLQLFRIVSSISNIYFFNPLIFQFKGFRIKSPVSPLKPAVLCDSVCIFQTDIL